MIKEIIEVNDTSLIIDLPKEYIGKKVECIIFPLEEKSKKIDKKSLYSLKGALQKYKDLDKVELENNAWKSNIQKKYKLND